MPLGSWTVDRVAAGALAVTATLLLSIAYLTRRIAGQAAEIEESIYQARDRSRVIFDVPKASTTLQRMTARLAQQRSGGEA